MIEAYGMVMDGKPPLFEAMEVALIVSRITSECKGDGEGGAMAMIATDRDIKGIGYGWFFGLGELRGMNAGDRANGNERMRLVSTRESAENGESAESDTKSIT